MPVGARMGSEVLVVPGSALTGPAAGTLADSLRLAVQTTRMDHGASLSCASARRAAHLHHLVRGRVKKRIAVDDFVVRTLQRRLIELP